MSKMDLLIQIKDAARQMVDLQKWKENSDSLLETLIHNEEHTKDPKYFNTCIEQNRRAAERVGQAEKDFEMLLDSYVEEVTKDA